MKLNLYGKGEETEVSLKGHFKMKWIKEEGLTVWIIDEFKSFNSVKGNLLTFNNERIL